MKNFEKVSIYSDNPLFEFFTNYCCTIFIEHECWPCYYDWAILRRYTFSEFLLLLYLYSWFHQDSKGWNRRGSFWESNLPATARPQGGALVAGFLLLFCFRFRGPFSTVSRGRCIAPRRLRHFAACTKSFARQQIRKNGFDRRARVRLRRPHPPGRWNRNHRREDQLSPEGCQRYGGALLAE